MIKNNVISYKDSVANICATLSGKVFETTMMYEDFTEFRKSYVTLAEKQEQGKMIVRFVADEKIESSWKPVEPQLEDVFLAEYAHESTTGGNNEHYLARMKKALYSPTILILLVLFSIFNIFTIISHFLWKRRIKNSKCYY
ncbi:hypothetical protein [Lysinibacillus pakistanensis]|uniref:hypothetical protein n=1 Tax=Lysinibacillus pakistanensis TaxID=759811 RepID=UPI003D26CEA4